MRTKHLLSILVTFFVMFFAFFAAGLWADVRTEEVAYHGTAKDTKATEDTKTTKGYLASPDGKGPFPAVILIHEWWGLNDNIRAEARRYAEEGYVALAVDLYGGESAKKPEDARALAGAVQKDMDAAFANLRSAISYLKGNAGVDKDRIASVGWCFGGGWSYQMAKNNLGTKASVIYYGRFNPADDLAQMRAKIMGHFGEKDRAIRADDVRQFGAKLKTLSGEHEVFIYPNAGHGFANPGNPAHDPAATGQANRRTLEFLRKYL